MIMRIVVVLPAPLGPMNPYSPPSGTTRSKFRTATLEPKVLVTPLRAIASPMSRYPSGVRVGPPARGPLTI